MATTMYVAWHKWNRVFIAGVDMQTEGPFIASETIDITTGGSTNPAPAGAEYAAVWADAPFEFAIGLSPTAAKGNASKAYPGNDPVQVPVIGGNKIAGIII
ncbi:hypothetical protein [Rhodopila sp.]|uniref:hypothetical protein n=1 Tax=Rhodopila sp. TaxID=2480087 RepID=UPI003D10E13F